MRFRLWQSIALTFLIGVVTMAPATAWAQGSAVGVQGGVNFANVSFTDPHPTSMTFDQRVGGVVGLLIANDFNRNVGLQVEVLYSQKGTKPSGSDIGGDLDLRVDYLEFPVFVRANLHGGNDTVVVRLFGGPSFGAKVGDKQVFDGEELTGDDKLDLKSYDIGLAIGGLVEFSKRAFVTARYTWGLTNIDNDPDDVADGVEVKNRTFTLMFGVRFR